jgi:hypothetical protein
MNDATEAEWVAKVGGTKDSWTTTQRTNLILPANEGPGPWTGTSSFTPTRSRRCVAARPP